eukprot:CAMPEP_0170574580 /NCGR_PEP_ID=MMETSP0224-20130122/3377_1 /TAXON_ID=285029 /ORGANISM="Togula jolla, Strain CCCM 725" /LENGTH=447 /DNA_ID=CAMNT_0010897249 /DNA_START=24 /DNA_END=1363 /DNA_ORIENTATION=+
MSLAIRRAYWVCAFFCIAFMGGSIYGWPSVRTILRRDNTLYTAECAETGEDPCTEQELAFGMIFAIGAWANQGGRLLVGIVLDRVGPRITATFNALFFAAGAAIFGMADSTLHLSMGLFLIGLGGAGVQMAVQSVSALFPRNKSLVMATLSGAFQMAAGVPLIFERLHEADVSRETLMFIYAFIALTAAFVSAVVWPMQPFNVPKVPGRQSSREQLDAQDPGAITSTSSKMPLCERTFREQVLSQEYLLMVAFLTLNVLQCQFTVGTIGTQFELKVDGDTSQITRFFGACLTFSFPFTPLLGHLIDRFGFIPMLTGINTVLICTCALFLAPSTELLYVACVLYAAGRLSLWASFFSYTGAYFGFVNYGKLAGGGLCFAATVSLLQYPLLDITLGPFEKNFDYVNSMFLGISVMLYGGDPSTAMLPEGYCQVIPVQELDGYLSFQFLW